MKEWKLFRTHGITRDENLMHKVPDGGWYYEQIELGFNYRMTDLQAALGISQMNRVDEFVSSRHKQAQRYDDRLKDLPIILPFQADTCYSSFHLYVIRLNLDLIEKSHKQVFEELRSKDIGVNLHYIPVHLHPTIRQWVSNLETFQKQNSTPKRQFPFLFFMVSKRINKMK